MRSERDLTVDRGANQRTLAIVMQQVCQRLAACISRDVTITSTLIPAYTRCLLAGVTNKETLSFRVS